MAITPHHSNSTVLKDRVLWFDGSSTVLSDEVLTYFAKYGPASNLFVHAMTDEINQYNKLVSSSNQLHVKEVVNGYSLDWNLPPSVAELNIEQYVMSKLCSEIDTRAIDKDWSDDQVISRVNRTKLELELYQAAGLTDIIRTLIYIINRLEAEKVVWGVGRGSSVSSYVLYLIGVHDVDSVEYDLDITEFLRLT